MKTVIIGGVAGGASAAARLRRNDESMEIVLLEKGPYISFANCGLPYRIGEVITQDEDLLLQTPESFNRRFRVDVRVQNEVLSVNPEQKSMQIKNLLSGEIYTETFDSLIISCGAKPIAPPFPGVEFDHVFTLRNIPDTLAIQSFIQNKKPKTATIIGGGYIGIEMAENLYHRGLEVSIVEATDHIIGSIDADMSYDLQNHLRSKGISLHLSARLSEIHDRHVVLEGGKTVQSDFVLLSIGVAPETNFLENSGVTLGKRGEILVDSHLRTNKENIYAIGDAIGVTSFVSKANAIIPLASPANKQGRMVADIICGHEKNYHGTQGTAIAKIFDMTVAVTGESERTLSAAGIDYQKTLTFSNDHASYYPGAMPMFIKLLFDLKGKILGAQITGYEGVDKRIDVIATAIRAGMTVYDLQELELAYAPPFSSAKDPVNMAGYVAENVLHHTTNMFYLSELPEISEQNQFIDVRTESEFELGHIPGSINIPLDNLRECFREIDPSKNIYITCQVGLRGYIAQRILAGKGIKSLNLAGGYRHYQSYLADLNAR